MSTVRRGMVYGVAAYAMWGVFPLYFPLLAPATPVEILAHRIVWSLLIVTVLLLARRRLRGLGRLTRRQYVLLGVAAITLSLNWLTYVYGVTTGHVVETSLGYFVNPLVTVALGVVVLGERLRRLQWLALVLATLAVLVLTADYGRLPWIALTLAFSFGFYGLLKKQANVGSVESLAVETLVLAGPAAAYLGWLAAQGSATFGAAGPGHALLLAALGLVTALPLLCFGGAATRIPLSTLGLLQYLAPTLQFLIGVLVFAEPMPPARLAGFALVWLALILFTAESLHNARRQAIARRADAEALALAG
jgi:chloramphenicol-sensitive protein RarD